MSLKYKKKSITFKFGKIYLSNIFWPIDKYRRFKSELHSCLLQNCCDSVNFDCLFFIVFILQSYFIILNCILTLNSDMILMWSRRKKTILRIATQKSFQIILIFTSIFRRSKFLYLSNVVILRCKHFIIFLVFLLLRIYRVNWISSYNHYFK